MTRKKIIKPVFRRKENFNLGEVLIVIIVVFALGWITWNQFELAQKKAHDVDKKANLHELSKVVKRYYADYQKLPSEELINSLWGKKWIDGNYVYMEKIPQEEHVDKQFCYKTYDDGVTFGLLAELENRKDEACKDNSFECGGKNYCFEDKMSAIVNQ